MPHGQKDAKPNRTRRARIFHHGKPKVPLSGVLNPNAAPRVRPRFSRAPAVSDILHSQRQHLQPKRHEIPPPATVMITNRSPSFDDRPRWRAPALLLRCPRPTTISRSAWYFYLFVAKFVVSWLLMLTCFSSGMVWVRRFDNHAAICHPDSYRWFERLSWR